MDFWRNQDERQRQGQGKQQYTDTHTYIHAHTNIGVLTNTHMIFIFCAIFQRCLPKLIYALVTTQISRELVDPGSFETIYVVNYA